ncbi:HEAT repeat domain-containing protein [Gammaproteobacteria bacterium]|nr:HEAT repeat domain-containing protein [Gammaproteobacteria bacterium]
MTLISYTKPEDLIKDYVTRGLVVLSPQALGIPETLHETIYDKERKAFSDKKLIDAELIPEILEVLNAPGLAEACNNIVGEDWAIVPFTHNTPFVSGSHDQHWHKDDTGPFNARRVRYHHPIQIEMLYYPQAVGPLMGPTATIPYSQYWTFNHEENHDNFAGADHLDFQYQINGMEKIPVSGPKSDYPQDDILNRRTAHDIRLKAAVKNTGWPLAEPFEVGPLDAGSVVLYSHNLFHRGNHRRDELSDWKAKPRFMWRFWLYRIKEPIKRKGDSSLQIQSEDSMTGQDLSEKTSDLKPVWKHHYAWLSGGGYSADHSSKIYDLENLKESLYLVGDVAEPKRIGAAYRLASAIDRVGGLQILEQGLYEEQESVRRASTYGLVAAGAPSSKIFQKAADSNQKWVRKAGAFGLGEIGDLSENMLETLIRVLETDSSVYVRSVAASAIGSVARRAAVATDDHPLLKQGIEALLSSLNVEKNRRSMDQVQERDIKFVRPTDECDVCEGIGIDYGHERFSRVRSVVRENGLWSLVIICGQNTLDLSAFFEKLYESLESVINDDRNIFSVGLAIDAINRLIRNHRPAGQREPDQLKLLLQKLPMLPLDSLSRGRYPISGIQRSEI